MGITGIGGWLGWFLGESDTLVFALIVFVAIDYITGLMCGIVNENLCSDVGFRGIFRKIIIFMLVGIAHMLDDQVIGSGGMLRSAVIFFYLSNEGISILENAGYLGLPIPSKVRRILEQLKDEAEETESDEVEDEN